MLHVFGEISNSEEKTKIMIHENCIADSKWNANHDEDIDGCMEDFPKKVNFNTGSGDRNRVELLSDQLDGDSRKKHKIKHQKCRRHHWPPRRKGSHKYDDGPKETQTFRNWRSRREVLPEYLEQKNDDFEEIEIDDEGKPVKDYIEGYEVDNDEEDDEDDDVEDDEEIPVEDRSGGNRGVCTCPPDSLSMENLKLQWKKFRSLVGRCYPALQCRNGGYFIFPECPPVDDGCRHEEDDVAQGQIIEPDHYGSDGHGYNADDDGHQKSEKIEEQPEDPTKSRRRARRASRSGGFPQSQAPPQSPAAVAPFTETTVAPFTETVVCYTPPFWAKFFQIVILAPLFAFTAFLFVEWFKARKTYNKKSSQLKRMKRKNEALHSECSRLEAYLMSAQMSPLANGRTQAKTKEEAARISQSLDESKRKMRELEEEKSVLLEVLHNLKKPDEDRVDPDDPHAPLPIFTNYNYLTM